MKQFLTFALLCIIISGCKSNSTSPNTAQTVWGSSVAIGTGTANSWVTVDAGGKFTSIGVTVSDTALTNLGNMDTMFELPMPSGVSTGPFKSIMLSYATKDSKPYDKPHLDPHFFLIDMPTRMNIMVGTDTMMPMNMTMPAGYMGDGKSEAMMGVHWMDTTAMAMGQSFHTAFAYGFSKGALVFLEAMADKATLVNHQGFTGTVRQPMMMSGMTMLLPTTYTTSYDASTGSSKIELDGF
jgi:hypothetical protein